MSDGVHRSVGAGRALIAAAWLALISGCASPPPPAPRTAARQAEMPTPPPAESESAIAQYERTQQARAAAAESQGRLADAALTLEVLALLQPDDPGYSRRLDALRKRIDGAVSDRLGRAEAAQRRGDFDLAAQLCLEALAMAPRHAAAAEQLRAIERERNRRSFVGRFSRQTLTRRAIAEGEMSGGNEASPGTSRNQLEHATLLARNGDLDAAIALLRDGIRGNGDVAQKSLLADLYVQRAEAQRANDPKAARASVNAALALDPAHAAARALARRLPPEPRPAPVTR